MDNARQVIFETYCRLHTRISLASLATSLNMGYEEAEKWIAQLIQQVRGWLKAVPLVYILLLLISFVSILFFLFFFFFFLFFFYVACFNVFFVLLRLVVLVLGMAVCHAQGSTLVAVATHQVLRGILTC